MKRNLIPILLAIFVLAAATLACADETTQAQSVSVSVVSSEDPAATPIVVVQQNTTSDDQGTVISTMIVADTFDPNWAWRDIADFSTANFSVTCDNALLYGFQYQFNGIWKSFSSGTVLVVETATQTMYFRASGISRLQYFSVSK